MASRGIKGATTCAENTPESIVGASRELLERLIEANDVVEDDVAAIWFTCTTDLNATFPARVARERGFMTVPLACAQEIDVPGALARCIRVLMLVNSDRAQAEMRHVYMRGARVLRPEFAVDE